MIIKYHPSSNRLFAPKNYLEKLITSSETALEMGHQKIATSIKNNNHPFIVKGGEYLTLGLYDVAAMSTIVTEKTGYFALEFASRFTESVMRGVLKILDFPGKIIEKNDLFLGDLHKLTSLLAKKTSNFINSKKYFQLPKDLTVVALSLTTFCVLATNIYNQKTEINDLPDRHVLAHPYSNNGHAFDTIAPSYVQK